MLSDQVIYTERQIQTAVSRLAKETIDHLNTYPGNDTPIHILVVMDGAFVFASDFIRYFEHDAGVMVHFIKATSYTGDVSSGHVKIDFVGPTPNLAGVRIIVLDDIIDSGDTILAIHRWLSGRGNSSTRTICLFRKVIPKTMAEAYRTARALIRHPEKAFVRQIHSGLDVEPGEFIVGYGLDYNGEYRHLPYVIRYEKT